MTAVETRSKFNDRLRVPLNVVEQGHQSSEGVSDRVGAAMPIEDINHLKSLAMISRTRVVKEKAQPPILDSNPKLTLPIATSICIGSVSDEEGVRAPGANSSERRW